LQADHGPRCIKARPLDTDRVRLCDISTVAMPSLQTSLAAQEIPVISQSKRQQCTK
jgi:hypothetical protein